MHEGYNDDYCITVHYFVIFYGCFVYIISFSIAKLHKIFFILCKNLPIKFMIEPVLSGTILSNDPVLGSWLLVPKFFPLNVL